MTQSDLEQLLDARHRRADALHNARKSWGEPGGGDTVDRHACQVTKLAAAFTAFLTDGTVHQDPDEPGPEPESEPAPVPVPTFPGPFAALGDNLRKGAMAPKVMTAALAWVEKAQNSSSPPHVWADDHDYALINAVRSYLGQEPLK